MKQVLFLDGVCPYVYDFKYLKTNPSGASESYLNMLARALYLKGKCEVYIFQHNRKKPDLQHGIKYIGFDDLENLNKNNIDAVVVQRHTGTIPFAKKEFKNAKIVLWNHDFFESTSFYDLDIKELKKFKTPIVCLTEWHKKNFQYNFELRGAKVDPNVIPHFVVENEVTLKNDVITNKIRNEFTLGFFSSEHKGLKTTLQAFSHLFMNNHAFNIYVASPSYHQFKTSIDLPNLHLRECQSRSDVMKLMSECHALLHLNNSYPETFGCVHAEANLVGTPVYSYDLGANREVIDRFNDFVIEPKKYSADPFGYDTVLQKIMNNISTGVPNIQLKKEFELDNVLPKWQNLLEIY